MPKIVPISYKVLVKIFEAEGCRAIRHEGSHIVMVKPGIKRPVVIPTYDQVPIFIIKNCLRTAGISRERYLELVKQTH